MQNVTTAKRPLGITIIAILLFISAIFEIIGGLLWRFEMGRNVPRNSLRHSGRRGLARSFSCGSLRRALVRLLGHRARRRLVFR